MPKVDFPKPKPLFVTPKKLPDQLHEAFRTKLYSYSTKKVRNLGMPLISIYHIESGNPDMSKAKP